jgi:hypothetical protein
MHSDGLSFDFGFVAMWRYQVAGANADYAFSSAFEVDTISGAAQLLALGIIKHHEKNDRTGIVCYLHYFCVRQPKRADECLAAIAGTHASADMAGDSA